MTARRPLLRLEPVARLAAARTATGERANVVWWPDGRAASARSVYGLVIGCGPSPVGGGADCIVIAVGPLRGYLRILSLAQVAYIESGGDVLAGDNAGEAW